MEEERTHREIELRSEEVQEVMGKIPPAILRYGIVVLLGIMAVVLAGSACFSYPDTVETEFTLTTQNPPAYIMAQSAGRIEQLYTANSQPVGKGDMLGVIENVARTEDLFVLRERMKEWKQGGSRTEQVGTLFFHRIAELGSVQAAYSSCLLAWNNYLQHMQESRTYETEVANTVAGLLNAVAEWEKNYLLTAPADGTVAFMQLWKRNQYVEAGETMFVIVPHDAALPVGKALLPMEGIGKVRTGQRVIIRLPAFPEQEFGTIEEGGVRLPRARRTGKVCTGNSTAAGTDHPLWQRTAFDKDHDGNGIHRHEGKKPAQQVAEFKIRVYGSHNM